MKLEGPADFEDAGYGHRHLSLAEIKSGIEHNLFLHQETFHRAEDIFLVGFHGVAVKTGRDGFLLVFLLGKGSQGDDRNVFQLSALDLMFLTNS